MHAFNRKLNALFSGFICPSAICLTAQIVITGTFQVSLNVTLNKSLTGNRRIFWNIFSFRRKELLVNNFKSVRDHVISM